MSKVASVLVALAFVAGFTLSWVVQPKLPQPNLPRVTVEELLLNPSKYQGKTVAVTGYTYFYSREMRVLGDQPVQTDFYLVTPDQPRTGRGVIVAVFQESERPILHSEKKSEIWARWDEIEVTGRRQYGLLYLTHVSIP